jgi:polysaccharide biosynthesis transport protein
MQVASPTTLGRIDIGRYGKLLYKRRWTVATFFVIVVTLITLWTLVQTPIYRATTILQIQPAPPDVVSFKDVVSLGSQNYWANKEYYQTQFWIIRSERLAQEVVDLLNLTETDPVFRGSKNAATQLSGMLQVQPLKNSQLVAVTMDHPDPEQAARICNMVAKEYQQQNVRYKLEASQDVLDWFDKRSPTDEVALKMAEQEMLDFMKANDIVSFEEKQNIVLQRLQDLSEALTQAQRKRIETQAGYQKAVSLQKSGNALQLPQATENELIQKLKEERILLEKQYEEWTETYLPISKKMVKMQKQIDLLNSKISEEMGNIVGSLKADYQIALSRETKLGEAVDEAKALAQDLNEKGIEYGVLRRKVESETDIVTELVRRAKETQVTKTLDSNNIMIRQNAEVPTGHIKPKRKMNVILGALLGLFGGIALAFLLDYLDNTIRTQEDLEKAASLPFLGIIPSFSDDDGEVIQSELFTHAHPKSSITESVRSIRTNIIFSSPEAPLRKLLVSSAGPQEGKSTTVINLGIVFAQAGNRVLIIDSDLRRPRLHKAFGVGRGTGLTTYIMGEAGADEVIVQSKVPDLYLIPSGPIPPNPSELLGSSRMDEVIAELETRFDIILFDSPPIVAVTDAVVLSKKVDGVVLIVKAGKTTSDMVARVKKQLSDVGSHILGSVLNDFNLKGEGYRYYYYYHYYRSDDDDTERRKVKKKRRTHLPGRVSTVEKDAKDPSDDNSSKTG